MNGKPAFPIHFQQKKVELCSVYLPQIWARLVATSFPQVAGPGVHLTLTCSTKAEFGMPSFILLQGSFLEMCTTVDFREESFHFDRHRHVNSCIDCVDCIGAAP